MMDFNQTDDQNGMYRQMQEYFLKNQNRWYTGTHTIVPDNHPVHYISLDDTFFKPAIDEENPSGFDSLDSFFTEKLALDKLHISGLISQIYKRNEIKDSNLYKIDTDIIKCRTQLFEIENIPKLYDSTIARTKNTLEREILSLEKEKRAEYVSWWRDLVLVKRDLINTLKEFKSSEKRLDLIMDKDTMLPASSNYYIPENDRYS